MNMNDSLLPLLENAAMLLAMVTIFYAFSSSVANHHKHVAEGISGVLLGLICIGLLSHPLEYAPGVIFDTRAVLLSLCGLFFGWLAALIAVSLSALYRIFIDGPGVIPGILVIAISGALGLLWRRYLRTKLARIRPRQLLCLGLVASIVNLLPAQLMLGDAIAGQRLALTVAVFLILPVTTVVVGLLLSGLLRRSQLARELQRNMECLRLALAGSNQALFDIDVKARHIAVTAGHSVERPGAARTLSFSVDSWLQKIHPQDREQVTRLYRDHLKGSNASFRTEFRLSDEQGGWIWMLAAGQLDQAGAEADGTHLLGTVTDISQIKRTEENLRIFQELQEQSHDGIVVLDVHGKVYQANRRFAHMLGYGQEETATLHVWDWDVKWEPEKLRSMLHSAGDQGDYFETRHQCKDGRVIDVEISTSGTFVGGRKLIFCVCRDISGRKRTENALKVAAMVYQNSREGMMVTAADSTIIDVNPTFSKVTGYEREEIIGAKPSILHSGQQGPEFYGQMWDALHHRGEWEGEIWNRRKNGEIYPQWLSISAVYDEQGELYRWVAQFNDITEQKQAEQLIWKQANFDTLTGLPNRRMFNDRLEQEVKKAQRNGSHLALMFLDLDHFKEVNDSLGHAKGDILLQQAAERLQHCVRETDTLTRLGGDEFVIILSGLENTANVGGIAQKILWALARPFELGSDVAYVTTSIGITLFPEDAQAPEDLLKKADQAMYDAKKGGRNRYQYFTAEMQVAVTTRIRLANDMRGAIDKDQLTVAYQPIVDLASGKIIKAEALMRWEHPDQGLISPSLFIPIAEDTGLIHELGDWLFAQVMEQLRHWRQLDPDFQISINKSPIQFRGNSADTWISTLRDAGIPGRNIVVEITESVLLDAHPTIHEQLLDYRDAGIQVALDDFGTGYSSLAYLKKFHIDCLKIDRTFISNLAPDNEDMVLSQAIISMAHRLGLQVIAEGVETETQRALLLAAGCDYGQGYLFSRPCGAEQFGKLLKQDRARLQAGSLNAVQS